MRIAVWNIDRLRRKSRLNDIISACEDIKADILVLTEADERVTLQGYDNVCRTERPEDHKLPQYAAPIHYAETERRVIIYSKYQIAQQHHTYNARTACCVELKTCSGDLSATVH